MTPQNLDNHLVRQKDHLLGLCNDEKYEEALLLLDFVAPLWAACSYEYKTREIRERIRREVREHVFQSTHWKTEEKWKKLEALIPY